MAIIRPMISGLHPRHASKVSARRDCGYNRMWKNVTSRKRKGEATHSFLSLGFEPILDPECVATVFTSARTTLPTTAAAPAIATETETPIATTQLQQAYPYSTVSPLPSLRPYLEYIPFKNGLTPTSHRGSWQNLSSTTIHLTKLPTASAVSYAKWSYQDGTQWDPTLRKSYLSNTTKTA